MRHKPQYLQGPGSARGEAGKRREPNHEEAETRCMSLPTGYEQRKPLKGCSRVLVFTG